MSFGIITHKSFVNSWECDENVHLNVQFYWKRFDQAAEIFQHSEGLKQQRWTSRHVRYHAELGMSANTLVRSACVADSNSLVHQLYGAGGEVLSASAVDQFADPFEAPNAQVKTVPDAALPRSLQTEPLLVENTKDILEDHNGVLSHLSKITPSECDGDGTLLDENHISRFSDAAGHFWHHMGIDRSWMQKQNLGSVAVEMMATRHALPKAGMITEITSWIDQVNEKTFSFRHQVHDRVSKNVLYSGAVTALMMDLTTRKAIVLPNSFREKVQSA